MIQIAAFEKMINLDAEVGVSVVKIMVGLIFGIDGNGKNTEINLIKVLLQLSVIRFKIWSLEIVLFLLIPCFVDIVTKKQYL